MDSDIPGIEHENDGLQSMQVVHSKRGHATAPRDTAGETIEYGLQAQGLNMPPSDRIGELNNLGCSLTEEYKRVGDTNILDEAIHVARLALAEATPENESRLVCLISLITRLQMMFDAKGRTVDYQEAMRLTSDALKEVPPWDPQRGILLASLSSMVSSIFERTGFWRDIEESIRLVRLALECVPPEFDQRSELLHNRATLLFSKYQRTKDLDDLQESIRYSKEALQVTSSDDARQYVFVDTYLEHLKLMFDATESLIDLENAIAELSKAQWAIPDHNPRLLKYLDWLGYLLAHKYARFGRFEELRELATTAMNFISQKLSLSLDDIDEMEETRRIASSIQSYIGRLERIASGGENAGQRLAFSQWCSAMKTEFNRRFEKDFISAIYELSQPHRNLELLFEVRDQGLPRDQMEEACDFALLLPGIATASFRVRFPNIRLISNDPQAERVQNIRDVERELSRAKEAYSLNPGGRESFIYRLVNLSHEVLVLDMPTGDTSVFSKAKEIAQLALVSAGSDRPTEMPIGCDTDDQLIHKDDAYAIALGQMAAILRFSYMKTGSTTEAREACRYAAAAVGSTVRKNPSLLFMYALTLKARYKLGGDISHLDQAIENLRHAVTDYPRINEYAHILNEMGLTLRLRFLRTGDTNDIHESIGYLREALHISRGDAKFEYDTYNNLAICLQSRYERTNALDDLEESICQLQKGLEVMGGHHPSYCTLLLNLGNAMNEKFKRSHDQEHLDGAVLHASEAVNATPRTRYEWPSFAIDLSSILLTKYDFTGNENDLLEAIRYSEEAIQLLPFEDYRRVMGLQVLGELMIKKRKLFPSDELAQSCIDVLQAAFECKSTSPMKRIQAGRDLGKFLFETGHFQEMQSTFENVVAILARTDLRWLEDTDRQHALKSITGLASDAAASALLAGSDSSRALELLEQSRGLTLGFIMDYRMETPVPSGGSNDTIREFNHLRMEIDSIIRRIQFITSSEQKRRLIQEHRVALESLEGSIEKVRSLPGWERFMLPPQSAELIRSARNCIIAVVNSSECMSQSHAILVQSSGIRSVPLPQLAYSDAVKQVQEMKHIVKGSLRTFVTRNKAMRDLLLWVWESTVRPIFHSLGLLGESQNECGPHIVWIGVGILGGIPFHAAGDCAPKSDLNAMSRVVSSYVPTIRALLLAQAAEPRRATKERKDTRLLLVTNRGSERSLLHWVDAEKDSIMEATQSIHVVALDQPTSAVVMEQLPLYNFVHFACHGVSDALDPLNSHLILSRGTPERDDGTAERLRARQIAAQAVVTPDVAFLSACSTAESLTTGLEDEVMHIATAFQTAGFKHVVATAWQANDSTCREVARQFYERLLQDPEEQWDGEWEVAQSLHYAVDQARKRNPDLPLLWAPFVHIGP